MRFLYILLALVLIIGCSQPPHWTDGMNSCLKDDEVELLLLSHKRFQRVISERYPGKSIAESYKGYLEHVSRLDLIHDVYHELLIKETTKLIQASSVYDKLWQKSSTWVLNDGRGTPVYLINGFADVPVCMASSSSSEWLQSKVKSLEKSSFPVPSNLANEMLNVFTTKDLEDPYHQLFIAISLCYSQALGYYDQN